MSIRIGRVIYKYGKMQPIDESIFPDYKKIIVTTRSRDPRYSELSPYYLKDEYGRIMENIWQFSKVYAEAPKTVRYYSTWDKTVIWDHPHEVHYKNEELTPEYSHWREKGFNCKYAVRYPVGYCHRTKCLFAIADPSRKPYEKLDYVASRKKIYFPVYCKLVKTHPVFKGLKKEIENGRKVLIYDVDGPHEESMEYYAKKYDMPVDFIVDNTVGVTATNMDVLLNDPKHPFGHGYCLGMKLLGMNIH